MSGSKKLMALAIVAILVVTGVVAVTVFSNQNKGVTTDQAETISIVDDRGVNVTVPKYPQRILSLGTAFTECLYAIGAEGQIIGVDSTSKYPAAVSNKTNIGSAYTINLENVTMLQPDLIIMWKSYTTSLNALTNLNMTVMAFDPTSVADVERLINKLGNVTGKASQAHDVVTNIQERIAAVEEKLANDTTSPKVYMELLSSGGKSPGPGTMTDDVIRIAGGTNINQVASARYTLLSTGYVLGENPEFIILETANKKTNDAVKNTPGWGSISAVVNDDIKRIDGAWLTASPRIVLAIETFAEWFHPEAFAE